MVAEVGEKGIVRHYGQEAVLISKDGESGARGLVTLAIKKKDGTLVEIAGEGNIKLMAAYPLEVRISSRGVKRTYLKDYSFNLPEMPDYFDKSE